MKSTSLMVRVRLSETVVPGNWCIEKMIGLVRSKTFDWEVTQNFPVYWLFCVEKGAL